jgi:membrane-associated phospholipid phosphatase
MILVWRRWTCIGMRQKARACKMKGKEFGLFLWFLICIPFFSGAQSDSVLNLNKGYLKSYVLDTRDLILFPREIKKKDWIFISSAATATGLAFYFDEEIENAFRKNEIRTDNHKPVDYSLGAVGNGIFPLAAAATLYIAGRQKENEYWVWLSMLQLKTVGLAAGFSRVPKYIAQRHRPNLNSRVINPWNWEGPLNGLSGNYSFLSGHSFIAFSWASVTASACKDNKLLVAGLYTLASLVGISRVYQGEHWMSDVVAGAAMGYAFGKLSYRLQTKNWTTRKKINKEN